jgi:hypothetical protein
VFLDFSFAHVFGLDNSISKFYLQVYTRIFLYLNDKSRFPLNRSVRSLRWASWKGSNALVVSAAGPHSIDDRVSVQVSEGVGVMQSRSSKTIGMKVGWCYGSLCNTFGLHSSEFVFVRCLVS